MSININNTKFVIINWNANGIKRNRNTLAAFLSHHNVDIACISETHLSTPETIKFNGYSIYRNDRIAARPSGGVALIIRTKIKHQQAYIPPLRSLEAVAITLSINNINTTIVSAYQSPSFNMYTNDFDKILTNYNKVIIIGDLNSKHVSWNCNTTNPNGRKLYKYLSNSSTIISAPDKPTYYPYDPNKSPDILDVVLLKSTSVIINQEPLFELDSDHLPVKISIGASLTLTESPRKLINGKPDWDKFKRYISDNIIIPRSISNTLTADEAISHFRETISKAAEQCTTVSSCTFNSNYKSNITPSIQKLIKNKHQIRKQWQLHRRPEDRQNLNFLTKKIKTLLAELRIESYQKYLSTIHPADSNLWLATKRLIKPNNNKIPPLKSGNKFINNVNEKCNLFATTLANTFTLNSQNDDATNHLVSQKLSEAEIFPQNIFPYTNPSELSEIIKKLPNRKSPGHDLITNSILKKLPNKAVVFLTVLFNALLKLSYFPTAWKKAKIIMIKKPGKDNTDPKNYRPISLLSSVSKIFEKIIHSRLINHLNATEAIPHCQFGFKPKHST